MKTTTDKITLDYLGFWCLPNTYNSLGIRCFFNTKEEAIKYYQKIGYTFTNL